MLLAEWTSSNWGKSEFFKSILSDRVHMSGLQLELLPAYPLSFYFQLQHCFMACVVIFHPSAAVHPVHGGCHVDLTARMIPTGKISGTVFPVTTSLEKCLSGVFRWPGVTGYLGLGSGMFTAVTHPLTNSDKGPEPPSLSCNIVLTASQRGYPTLRPFSTEVNFN